jgi:hypothetical protein
VRIILAAALLAGCGGGGGSGRSGVMAAPIGERYPIDGIVDLSGFAAVNVVTVDIRDGLGTGVLVKQITVRWAFANDDRCLYFAAQWTDDTYDHDYDIALGPQVFDGVKILFDNDGDGMLDPGEDERTVIAASIGSVYVDQHVSAGDETDLIGDGFGKLSYDSANRTFSAEFLIPLTSDAAGEDAGLTAQARYNLIFFDGADLTNPGSPSGNAGAVYGLGNDSASWPALPLASARPYDYPVRPSNLTGLIVFISDDEETNGEIYSFDPATDLVTRVTNLPGLFKDNASLSHDRTRIAFHGSPDRNDYSAYEIYTVNIDGTNLTQLTSNAILDGHPGWSPDDSHIVYASFRNPGRASLVVMTDSGVEIGELTPAGADDNDPDFLPDGRIVFKTDRFSTSPELRIAVMNADGSRVVQVTDVDGVSDHDPVGDRTFAVFERFNKGTNYATDVEAMFTPWDLVEARLDGSGEETLLSDGWVNWLPVYDPSGGYICYLKNSGYTAAYLMSRNGKDFGRLIPDITRIRYIDWK